MSYAFGTVKLTTNPTTDLESLKQVRKLAITSLDPLYLVLAQYDPLQSR
jgi:hypothetical protein